MKPAEQLNLALEDLLRVAHQLPTLLGKLRAAMPGQPGAVTYDSPLVRGHVADPTGEQALERDQHPAVRDDAELRRRIRQVAQAADALVRITVAWSPRPPTATERRDTEAANEPACELHLRAGKRVPRHRLATSAYGWPLPRPMSLCHQCMRRIGDTRHIPDDDEMAYLVANGKWPRLLLTAAYRPGTP